MDLRESISMQNQISITLAKHVISTISKPSNVIFSPASINVILSITAAGSTGSTKSVKMMINSIPRKCECFDLYDQLIPYKKAWSWQKQIIKEKTSLINNNQYCQDTLILLQHPPVYTMGTGSKEDYLNFDIKDAPYDIYRTERGGEVTYHGPGQLVMYPIINLRNHKMDLHWYLRMLEEVVIRVLYSAFDIKATRLDGLTGVWVGNQKVAAIGIRVSKWMTYHGLALNVTTDLTPFKWIVPCGIRDRKVGSIKGLIMDREHIKMDDVQLIDIAHKSLLKEFSKVFHLQIEKQTNIFIPLQC